MLITRIIDAFVRRVPAHRVDVLVKGLLYVNQGALPWTVGVVFQRGDHDEIGFFLCHLNPSECAVRIASMPNVLNDDAFGGRLDLVNDAIVADAKPIELFGTLQLDRLGGEGVDDQSTNCGKNSLSSRSRQERKVFLRRRLVENLKRGHVF